MISRLAKYICIIFLFVSAIQAQVVIEGIVLDNETNKPVIGANVLIVGTQYGASTDLEGKFKIEWEEKLPAALQISHIGYITRELTVSLPTPLRIRLVPKVLRGEEVTVLGERSRSQAEASTAMDVMEIEKIELQGSRDVGSALRRISSVVINEASSGSQTVSIRGSNANEVAVYLDGVKINSANTGIADLSQIDLQSLQRIEVLRGGNTYLFGVGNLGGVLNLESQGAVKNSLALNLGQGLSFDDDLDLSVNGSGVIGPLGAGGRFSGRSRVYEGRTMTSSAFYNLFSDAQFPWGKFYGRWYQLRNALTFPSGDVALGDQQTITSIRYQGDVWRSTGWEFFVGDRKWTEENNFFDNMDQMLRDNHLTYRIVKDFRTNNLDAVAQLEQEEQSFNGNRSLIWPELNLIMDNKGIFSRKSSGLAMVSRMITEGNSPVLRRLQIEVSGRLDNILTTRFEETKNQYLEQDTTEIVINEGKQDNQFWSRRVGFRMEGITNKFRYVAFVGQGSNKRLPTLNDLFIKANTSVESLRDAYLIPENLNSTEINIQISFTEFLMTPVISELEFTGAYFKNNYDNKIGYVGVPNEPPVPYNEMKADISGFEISALSSLFNRKLQLHANTTFLDVENPYLFPNKPGFRQVLTADLNFNWLSVSYDYFKEGEQFVMGTTYGVFFQPRENANLTITLHRKIHGVTVSLAYMFRNLLSKGEGGLGSDLDILFFNYYNQYREIITFKVNL